jgi:hypothetical protein
MYVNRGGATWFRTFERSQQNLPPEPKALQ